MKKLIFDPLAPSRPGLVNAAIFRCPCGGANFNVTSRLAEAMGVAHYRCDMCKASYARRIGGDNGVRP